MPVGNGYSPDLRLQGSESRYPIRINGVQDGSSFEERLKVEIEFYRSDLDYSRLFCSDAFDLVEGKKVIGSGVFIGEGRFAASSKSEAGLHFKGEVDYAVYRSLKESGYSAEKACALAKANGMDEVSRLNMLRSIFSLSLSEARKLDMKE